ncbi:hypothetical protein SAMN05421810_103416 [Amycolatopsis arida]|uniref:Uncharacterized protein n=1 Tax=Amycolatopsis arida TaxID=587909 RepID=A0A1I5T6X9_9PSEU|nr:hypothetical protein [Amycolatopsis arida]TDX96205.1 hypothetical protein CLV69_103342 [Amycolatopsis arida]SFP78814.1 hypothetical protein SAMN05421810_103416 [Amycolatopsis arida]
MTLVVTALPPPPRLRAAADTVRAVLADTAWAGARVRLEVTDVDGGACPLG